MKKWIAMLLVLLIACTTLSTASYAADTSADGWTTVSTDMFYYAANKQPENIGTASVSAKGNELKIVITSDWINGDRLKCPGTKDAHTSSDWGNADGRLYYVGFSDGTPDGGVSVNELEFVIHHECGELADGHTVSLRKECHISLDYEFYADEVDAFGNIRYSGQVAPGYSGFMETGIPNLNITVKKHTLTVTTKLPDQVVDYRREDVRDLQFRSEQLQIRGAYNTEYWHIGEVSPYAPPQRQTVLQKVVAHIREVFEKFAALFRRIFHIQAVPQNTIGRYIYHQDGTVTPVIA